MKTKIYTKYINFSYIIYFYSFISITENNFEQF